MRYFIILFVLIIGSCNSANDNEADNNTTEHQMSSADFMKPKQISSDALPVEITVTGVFNEAWMWVDSLGENLLVLSHQIKNENSKDESGDDLVTGSAYTAHYLKKDGKYRSSRTSTEDEQACAFDLVCDFIPGSTTITDLDNNGFAEIKFQLIKTCRSDVSPATMHLVMREKEVNYVLIGTTWVPFNPGMPFNLTIENLSLDGSKSSTDEFKELERTMGKYNGEYQFSKAPPQFLQYARQEWLKYVKEKIGE